MQTFISLVLNFPFKWPRQEAKTKQHSQQQEAKKFANEPPSANEIFFGAVSQGLCADWLA